MLQLLIVAALAAPQEKQGLGIWDTGKLSAAALDLSARGGWTAAAEAGAAIKGDAVLSNGSVTLVVRRQDGGAELHAAAGPRARLVLPGAVRLERATVAESTRAAAALEAVYATAKGTVAVRYRLKRGDAFVEALPGAGAARLRVEAPGRFLVLPDFFADDIVVDAAKIAAPAAEVPSENFLLHLVGKFDAVVMTVFENRDQDVKLALAGEGAARAVAASEVEFGKDRRIWVAVLEGAGIWHSVDLQRKDAGKATPLGWKMPFPAVWRADFTNSFDLNDSWEMLVQEKEGGDYLKPAWFGDKNQRVRPNRQGFDAAVGGILHPAWFDFNGNGHVQPFNAKGRMEVTHRGPAIFYPINRLPSTPPAQFTVVDLVRNTLGVGPCEYILDVEGQKQELKGRATCSVEVEVNAIFEKGEQKRRRGDLEGFLKQGEAFVAHIRGRIHGYVDFGRRMLAFLADQKKAKPELAEPLAPLEKLLREIDASVEARKDKIQMPADHAAHFADFRKNLMEVEGPDSLARAKKWTAALVEIGGNQDELVAHCRWVVKNVRQKAGLLMVSDPRAAAAAGEVRAKAQEVLRAPSVHESTRR